MAKAAGDYKDSANDAEVMIKIIDFMLSESFNKRYSEILNKIKVGLVGKKHIDETASPRYQSIVLLGINIFPFSMSEYRKMALELEK